MIGERVPFEKAYEMTMGNKQRIYLSSGKGGSGFERTFRVPFPDLRHAPKFKLAKDAKVFTIGSCFAREVEASLEAIGIECPTRSFVLPGDMYEMTGMGARNGALNAYTPLSMRDTIELRERGYDPAIGALQVGDDEYVDMLMSGLRPLTREELGTVRGRLREVYASLEGATAVFITLGYTESWFDTVDGMYVNRSPGASIRTMRLGARYDFHNCGFDDTKAALEGILRSLTRLSPGVKVVLTVSPVPIHGTFTDRDVVSANLYSKSTLLSAAVAMAERHDFVDYFPSYEYALLSDPKEVWMPDGIHVRRETVDRIMAKFLEYYCS